MPSKYFQEAVKEILESFPEEFREKTRFGKGILDTPYIKDIYIELVTSSLIPKSEVDFYRIIKVEIANYTSNCLPVLWLNSQNINLKRVGYEKNTENKFYTDSCKLQEGANRIQVKIIDNNSRVLDNRFKSYTLSTNPFTLGEKVKEKESDLLEEYAIFHFDKDGKFVKGEPMWKNGVPTSYPYAVWDNKPPQDKLKIYFQDPSSDNLHFSGLLEEDSKKSSFPERKPRVEYLQLLESKDVKNILANNEKEIFKLKIMKDYNITNAFYNVFELAKDKSFNVKKYIDLVGSGMDFGAYLFDERVMYVIDVTYSKFFPTIYPTQYIGLNAKNMGNFIFGVLFQIFGYTDGEASALAHGWNLVKYGVVDSSDDQRAVVMGYEFARKKIGVPQIKRSANLHTIEAEYIFNFIKEQLNRN